MDVLELVLLTPQACTIVILSFLNVRGPVGITSLNMYEEI